MSDQHQPLRLRGSRTIGDETVGGSIGHRRLEDANVDYWRQRAGWSDDDETMKAYNQGVYNTYYMGDDATIDGTGSGTSAKSTAGKALDHIGWILGLASTVIFLMMLVKCCSSVRPKSDRKGRTSSVKSRDSSRSIRDKHGERRSRSRSRAASGRSRSKSRARSKSHSTKKRDNGGEGTSSTADYKLMDDDSENKSRRSTKSGSSRRTDSSRSRSRSKSKAPRSRSRSKARSKSKSRGDRGGDDKSEKKDSKEKKMLV